MAVQLMLPGMLSSAPAGLKMRAPDAEDRASAETPTQKLRDTAGTTVPASASFIRRLDAYPSSKQVAFAERIARIKRREIPRACFRDRMLMSRWIDSNLPR